MTDVTADLDAALSQDNWALVRMVIERAPDADAATRRAEPAMAGWPDKRRELPVETWRSWQGGAAPPPWIRLARHLRLEDGDRLDGIERARFLTSLDLSDYRDALAPLARAPQLRALELTGIDEPDLLSWLPELQSLALRAPQWLSPLDELGLPSTLRALEIHHADDLVSLRGVERLAALNTLRLDDDRQLTDIEPLAQLPALRQLTLARCRALSDVSVIGRLTRLEELTLTELDGVPRLPSLGALTALRRLMLGGKRLSDLSPLSALRALTSLTLRELPGVRALDFLAGCQALEDVTIVSCSGIDDIRPLAGVTSLHTITLSGLSVRDVAPLAALPRLATLAVNQDPPPAGLDAFDPDRTRVL